MQPFAYSLLGLCLLLTSLQSAHAQSFANEDAHWYYQAYCQVPFFIGPCGYNEVRVQGDTLIGTDSLRVLELFEAGLSVSASRVYVKNIGQQVYFYEANQLRLLYDFGLNAGDTLRFEVPTNMSYYDLGCGLTDSGRIYAVRIDSVDTLVVNGVSLRRQYTSYTADGGWNMGTIIERMGSEYGLMGLSITQCLGGEPGYFRCYSDSGLSYQASTETCDLTTSIYLGPPEVTIRAYPNPVIDRLLIEVPTPQPWRYEIVAASTGQLVQSETERLNATDELSLKSLPSGMYLLRIEVADGRRFSQRILKK